jgi:hypothetical protein
MIVIDNVKIHNRMNNINILKSVNKLILLVWLRNLVFSIPCNTVELLTFKLTVVPSRSIECGEFLDLLWII